MANSTHVAFQRELDKARTQVSELRAEFQEKMKELEDGYVANIQKQRRILRDVKNTLDRIGPGAVAKLRKKLHEAQTNLLTSDATLKAEIYLTVELRASISSQALLIQNADNQIRALRKQVDELHKTNPPPVDPKLRIRHSQRKSVTRGPKNRTA